jgi:prepilin-type processing-associated H-X9-DG protein
MHNRAGNVTLVDGSVKQVNIRGLRKLIANTGVATNRLALP